MKMRRVWALVMVLCLLIGHLPATAWAAESSATITFEDTAYRTVFTTEQQVWVMNGITFTNDKGSGSNIADYSNPVRCYSGSSVTVAYPGMTEIAFTCSTSGYATKLQTTIGDTAVLDGTVVTVTFDAPVDSYLIEKLAAQVRISSITVTAGTSDEPEETSAPTEAESTTAPTEPESTTSSTEPESTTSTEPDETTPTNVSSGTCGENVTWTLDAEGLLTISGTGDMKDYSGESVMLDDPSLVTEIVVQEGVTRIGNCAFMDCTNATAATIAQSVTSIGHSAFRCTALETIVIPAGVVELGNIVFYECPNLTGIWVDAENTVYCSDAYGVLYDKAMTELREAPDGLTGDYVIPDGVIGIVSHAFYGCQTLSSVTIPASVTSIGNRAFLESCNQGIWVNENNTAFASDSNGVLFNKEMTELIGVPGGLSGAYSIPTGVTTMCDYAFSNCLETTAVTIPGSLTTVSIGAFSGCTGLESVTIEEGVTCINLYAFDNCSSLKTVAIPTSMTKICNSAFQFCSSLSSVVLPENIETIEDWAFSGCSNLTQIEFQGNAPTISASAFSGVAATVKYPADNETWTEDVMQDYGGAITWVGNEPTVEIVDSGTCGDNLTWTLDANGLLTISGTGEIANEAFSCRTDITSVVIEEGVTSIGRNAFEFCENMTSISLPDSLVTIEQTAFTCSGLQSIIIPEGTTNIHDDAFFECSSLERIEVAEGNPNYSSDDRGVFFNKDKTTLICAPCALEGEYEIPAGVTVIDSYAFRGCTKMTGVTIPEGVTTIGYNAFYLCTGLTSITIPEGVEAIPSYAFYLCSNLASVTIPSSVTSIGSWAFSSCKSLASITIPAGVAEIDELAFAYSKNLTKIVFEGDAPTIWEEVFAEVQAEVYYPADNSTWTESVMQQYGGTLTWVSYVPTVASGTCGDNLTWTLDANGLLTISGTGAMYDYEVGAAPWQNYAEQITALVIEEGVTHVGVYAFAAQGNLSEVSIAQSVTSIGAFAFQLCTGLTVLDIPVGVVSIGNDAFSGCGGLTSVTIPNSVENIATFAFSDCDTLSTIIVPESVTAIGTCAFAYCDNLAGIWVDDNNAHYSSDSYGVMHNKDKTVLIQAPGALSGTYTVADSVTDIGSNAFGTCSALTAITFPEGLASIDSFALEHCTGLVEITFTGDAPVISGDNPFERVEATVYYPADNATWTEDIMQNYGGTLSWSVSVDPVEIVDSGTCGDNLTWTLDSNGLLTISGTGAMTEYTDFGEAPWFKYRDDILEVQLLEGVTSIGRYAFFECGLTNITIPNGVTSIGESAFYNSGLTSISFPNSVVSVGDNAFKFCTQLTQVLLSDGMTSIGNAAFASCESLTSIVIPDGVTELPSAAFSGCTSLQAISINGDVTKIADMAFRYCSSLTSFNIPRSVTEIGSEAFKYCSGLTEINIPNNVSSIDSYAFADCTGLTSIKISESVETIKDAAFAGCSNLTAVYFFGDAPCLGEGVFGGVIATVYYPAEDETWTEDVMQQYGGEITWKSNDTVILSGTCGETVTWTLDAAGLLTVSGTGEITDAIWEGNNRGSVKSVYIKDGITGIGEWVFNGMGLQQVSLPGSVTHIGSYAFAYGTLTDIEFREPGLLSLGSRAFFTNEGLADFTFPNTIESIGTEAFMHCMGITELVIPASVTKINNYAFSDCQNLKTVRFEGDAPTMGEIFEFISVTAYYPAGNETWTEDVMLDYSGEATWVAYSSCGENVIWNYADGVLTISGTGAMNDYEAGTAPWQSYIDQIEKVVIEDGITHIGSYAFYEHYLLYQTDVPNSVVSLGNYAFQSVYYNYLHFSSNMPATEAYSFGTGNSYVLYPNSNTTWTQEMKDVCLGKVIWHPYDDQDIYVAMGGAGEDLIWILDKEYTLTLIGSGEMCQSFGAVDMPWFAYSDLIQKIVLPEGLTSICTHAFTCIENVHTLTVPSTVTAIDTLAFVESSIRVITFTGDAPQFHEEAFWEKTLTCCYPAENETWTADVMQNYEGTAYWFGYDEEGKISGTSDDGSTWVLEGDTLTISGSGELTQQEWKQLNHLVKHVVIEDSFTAIGEKAFAGMSSMESVTIPASVTSIGSNAFSSLMSLTSVTFQGEGLLSIGKGAFSMVGRIEHIELPGTVTTIGDSAFSMCWQLSSIVIPASVTELGSYVFAECYNLEKITFEGDAPALIDEEEGMNTVFEGVTATAYHPADNTTWTEEIMKKYGGSLTWLREGQFALSGASVSLGNSLDMHFFLDPANVDENCYAVLTRTYADGRENHVLTVPYADWRALDDGTLYVTYGNIAAKEMGDTISVVIYNAEGEDISARWDDSIKTYAMRMLRTDEVWEDWELRTLYVDMLNYGAAAQSQFGYDTANLVNAGLTDEQKGFATASYETENDLVSGTGRAGTTLTLKSRITLDFIFKNTAIGTDYTGLYAVAAYTDHYGNEIETRIDTVKVYNANLGYVSVPGLAVADYGQTVTCTVYDAEGNVLAWATDSMEGYAHRMAGKLPQIVDAIMKFGVSSYNHFH